jgi:CspA family cold shock protein
MRPGANPHAKYGKQRGGRGETGGTGTGGGSIVSYDPKKGFGFISPERGGPDVFFHRNILQGVDPHALQRGVKVAFSAQQHERGVRASDMRLLEGSH